LVAEQQADSNSAENVGLASQVVKQLHEGG
jgi:hypothetical protein